MRIDRLELKNYRGFTSLDLDFTGHRTTVLVGSNGCGKTSVLDGLAAMLKCIAYTLTSYDPRYKISNRSPSFVPLDVNNKRTQLDLDVFLVLTGVAINFGITYKSSDSNYMTRRSGDYSKDFEAVYRSGICPVLVYYPVSRAVLDIPLRIDESHSFTQMDAYDGALDSNKRNFQMFFQWYRDREDLENEARQESGFAPDAQLQAVRTAVEKFMPGYSRLRVRRSPLRMTVMKGAQEVQVNQLSDGEKCLLALVGDLARRLALANPGADSPCDGTGVVLIDEIELHLHPRWQRSVIPNLEKTFPNCQFIVTTHSPQVLADVGPGAVVVLEPDEDGNIVAKRAKSPLGHDSNYILEVLMGVSERPQALADELERLFALIDDNDLAEAKKLRASIIEKWNADIPALTKAEVAIQRKERFAK